MNESARARLRQHLIATNGSVNWYPTGELAVHREEQREKHRMKDGRDASDMSPLDREEFIGVNAALRDVGADPMRPWEFERVRESTYAYPGANLTSAFRQLEAAAYAKNIERWESMGSFAPPAAVRTALVRKQRAAMRDRWDAASEVDRLEMESEVPASDRAALRAHANKRRRGE